MISHLLFYNNVTVLPYISCSKLMTVTGFNLLQTDAQSLSHLTVFLSKSFEYDSKLSSLLVIDSNGNQAENAIPNSSLFNRTRLVLDTFSSVTIGLKDSLGSNFLELVPLCDEFSLAIPTYIYCEVFPTAVQFRSSKYLILNTSTESPQDRNIFMRPLHMSKMDNNITQPDATSLNSFYQNELSITDDDANNEYSLVPTQFSSKQKPIHIAFVAGGNFDGQKQVMMSPWKHFQNNKLVMFTLIWTCKRRLNLYGICEDIDPTVQSILREVPYVTVIHFPPIQIYPVEFDEKPLDGSLSFNEYCQQSEDPSSVDNLKVYAIKRLRQSNRKIQDVTPGWVQDFWGIYVQYLGSARDADVVVVGNTGSISDALIPEAFLLKSDGDHSPTIVLDVAANSMPHPLFSYHAIISPSHYAYRTFTNVLSDTSHDISHLHWFIAQPGVHIEKLQQRYEHAKQNLVSTCSGDYCSSNQLTITVGFIGRLVPFKSPGVVLLVAQSVKRSHLKIRFLIIGGGNEPYMNSLRRLAQHLDVTSIVEFTGTVSQDELPSQLARLDILLNPTISPSETFCVVNIEAMAVGLPIVSYGTYGQGEYFINFDKETNRGNSVIVSSPTVHSLSNAVIMLASNATMRSIIGENAKTLVQERFHSYQAASRYISAIKYAHEMHHQTMH